MSSVTIEPLAACHRAAILRLTGDPTLSETSSVPHPCLSEHVEAWIATNNVSPLATLTFAVLDAGTLVGAVTLKRLDGTDPSGELAYWIGKEHWGKGYATAASIKAIAYGFDRLLLSSIHSHYLQRSNAASGKILAKVSFQPDPHRADLPVTDRFAVNFPGDVWTFVRLAKPVKTEFAKAAQEYQRLWNAMMTDYCGGRQSCVDLVLELIRQTLGQNSSLRVLDVGCGSGAFIESLLATKGLPGLKVVGIDRSQRNLAIARSLLAKHENVSFEPVDLTAGGWAEQLGHESFDVAFLGWMTHEVEPWHLPTLYREIGAALRPGGLVFNADFMSALPDSWEDFGRDYQRRRTNPAATSNFKSFNARMNQLPEIAKTLARSDTTNQTAWNVRHSVQAHLTHLRDAGFKDAEEIWRYLGYAMVMGIR